MIRQALSSGGSQASRGDSPMTQAADRMELGGGSSLGTARSTNWNDGDDAHSQASSRRVDRGGGEEGVGGLEFGNTRWEVPTPGQVRSLLMPGLEPGLEGLDSNQAPQTMRSPQVCVRMHACKLASDSRHTNTHCVTHWHA